MYLMALISLQENQAGSLEASSNNLNLLEGPQKRGGTFSTNLACLNQFFFCFNTPSTSSQMKLCRA